MAAFSDKQGRQWVLALTVAAAKRVRQATGIDLLKAFDARAAVLERLADDAVLLYEVLVELLRPQLQQRGLSEADLDQALDDAALEAAGLALVDAVLDFFPPSRTAPLRRLLERSRETLTRRQRQATAELQTAAETLDLDAALDSLISGSSATASPARSASTPAP